MAMAATGPLEMGEWDTETHRAVQAWAHGGDEMPGVIGAYFARIGGYFDVTRDTEGNTDGRGRTSPLGCAHCEQRCGPSGDDPCLGHVGEPGEVMNACCGHGEESGAYVQFWDRPNAVIRGSVALRVLRRMVTERDGSERVGKGVDLIGGAG